MPIVEMAKEHAILTTRDPARLNAFLDFPRQSMSGWHLLDGSGKIRGLAVLNLIPKDGGRTRTGKFVDCLLDGVDIDLWHAAFVALTGELKRQSADLAQAYASTPWSTEALRRSRFLLAILGEVPHPRPPGAHPARRAVPPHATGGGLCLYVGSGSTIPTPCGRRGWPGSGGGARPGRRCSGHRGGRPGRNPRPRCQSRANRRRGGWPCGSPRPA